MKWVAFFAALSIVSGQCPDDWSMFQQTCLALFNESLTWPNAQAKCRSYGGRLATLENKVKDLNMKMFLLTVNHYNGYIWMGGNDLVVESHWLWNDENLNNFTYTNWKHGEPNNSKYPHHSQKGEDCLGVQVLPDNRYWWVDRSCEERRNPFVCERDVRHSTLIG